MKNKLLFILLAVIFSAGAAFAQSSSFTFQGKLNDGAIAANGTYQFQFKLYDAAAGDNQVGQTIADIPATVTNGIFAVNLDFGAASFDGAARFIEIGVRLNGGGQNYTILNPRQAVASTPYSVKSLKSDEATAAVTANNSLNLGGIAASEYVQTNDTRMSDDRNPLANSGFYIQNGTSLQTTSNFNVSGEGRASILNAVQQYNLNGVRILDGSLGNGNLFAGFEAGMNNTGGGTTFVGVRAGKSNTTGIYNSFFGFVAEEINRAEPLLSTFNDKGEIEGVKYAQVTTVLVNSVKEQQTQIDQLQEQIKLQQTQIDALKALVCSQNPTAAVCALPEKK